MEQISQNANAADLLNEAYNKHVLWITNLTHEYENLLDEQSIENSPNTKITNVRKIWSERKQPPIFKYKKTIKKSENET